MWVISECPWGMLGFNLDLNDRVPIGTALTMAGVAFLFAQVRQVASASTDEVQGLNAEIGELSFLIPQNDGEMARFNMLSLTAGIVEETLWRGFLVWYLARLCRSGWPQ